MEENPLDPEKIKQQKITLARELLGKAITMHRQDKAPYKMIFDFDKEFREKHGIDGNNYILLQCLIGGYNEQIMNSWKLDTPDGEIEKFIVELEEKVNLVEKDF